MMIELFDLKLLNERLNYLVRDNEVRIVFRKRTVKRAVFLILFRAHEMVLQTFTDY